VTGEYPSAIGRAATRVPNIPQRSESRFSGREWVAAPSPAVAIIPGFAQRYIIIGILCTDIRHVLKRDQLVGRICENVIGSATLEWSFLEWIPIRFEYNLA